LELAEELMRRIERMHPPGKGWGCTVMRTHFDFKVVKHLRKPLAGIRA